MYSVVLTTALLAGAQTPGFGGGCYAYPVSCTCACSCSASSCFGSYGSYAAYGHYGCYSSCSCFGCSCSGSIIIQSAPIVVHPVVPAKPGPLPGYGPKFPSGPKGG